MNPRIVCYVRHNGYLGDDPKARIVGIRLGFWGFIRFVPLVFMQGGIIGIALMDIAIISGLRNRTKAGMLMSHEQLTVKPTIHQAISMGDDGLRVSDITSEDDTEVRVHL